MQFVAAVDIAFEHELLSLMWSNAFAEERIRSHPRKQIEQHFRQTHAHAFFSDDRMTTQCRFKAATQRVTLHQRDAVCADAKAAVESIHSAHTLARISQ